MKKGIDLMEAKNSTWGKTLSILIAIVMAISVFTPISLAYAAEQAAAAIEQSQEDENGTTSEDSNDASKTKDAAKEGNTESSDKVEKTDSKKTEKTSNATLDDFYAALDEMGDADDEAAILSVLKKIESVYKKLSKEDKAAVADEWAYVKNYRKSVEAGNPDEGIETLASGYVPVSSVGIYPDKKPAGNTATGKVRESGQSLTMKVGQKASFLLGAPTNTLVGSSCGHTIAVYNPSDYCDISLVDNSGQNIVGNPSYAAGNNDGTRVFDTVFEALKPGKSSDVRVCYYANFGIVFTNGANAAYVACPRCGRSYLVNKDTTWYRYNDIFGITVNADYVLKYDTQGGSKVASTTKTVANTSATMTVTSTEPTKEGYTFKGWNTEADGTGTAYVAGNNVDLNWSKGYGSEANPISQTLYAQWEKDVQDVSYRIDREYWINGEKVATVTGTTKTGKIGDELVGSKLDEDNPGWRTRTVDGEKRAFDYKGSNPESLTITADGVNVITLKYEINDSVEKTYTVIYTDGADGAVFGDESHGNLKEGDATPEFEGSTYREGYTFQGWTPAIKGTVDPDMANDAGEIIYTATWKNPAPAVAPEKPTHNEIYELMHNVLVTCIADPAHHKTPTSTFDCIINSKGEDHRDRINIGDVEGNAENGYTCTVTFYAEKYAEAYRNLKNSDDELVAGETDKDVTFIWNGKSWEPSGITGQIEFKVECPITVTWKDGYTDNPIKVKKAKWDISNEELAEFYPEDPERAGFEFAGWSDPVKDEKGNITITAQWTKMMIVQWMKGYGSATSAKIKNITIPVDADYSDQYPEEPTREGYNFIGWSEPVESAAGDGQKVITITAKWCNHEYVVIDNCTTHEEPDCDGHHSYCKSCGLELATEGHAYPIDWTTDKKATKDEAGLKYRECVDCGHKVTREIPKLGVVTINVQFVDEDGYVVKVEDPIELETGSEYDVSDLVGNIPDGYEANGETYGDDVTGIADANKTINVPVKKIASEQPYTPSPAPDPSNPTPGTPQPTPQPAPGPEQTPALMTPIVTPFAPVATPVAAPAAAVAVPAAADEATIEDDANPLAEAPEEQVIADDENALAGFDDPHCWTHWLMIFGATATIVYCGCVIVRRRNSIKKFDDFENEVLGIGEKRTAEAAQRKAAYNAYQSI